MERSASTAYTRRSSLRHPNYKVSKLRAKNIRNRNSSRLESPVTAIFRSLQEILHHRRENRQLGSREKVKFLVNRHLLAWNSYGVTVYKSRISSETRGWRIRRGAPSRSYFTLWGNECGHIFGQLCSAGSLPCVGRKVPKETFTAKLTANPGHSYSH